MNIESLLGAEYSLGSPLPSPHSNLQKFKVSRSGKDSDKWVISFFVYESFLSEEQYRANLAHIESLRRAPIPLICSMIDFRVERNYHWIISEEPGQTSLAELATPPLELRLEEVEAFVRLLSTACQSAVDAQWPPLNLSAEGLALNHKLGLPRIPFPDLLESPPSPPISKDHYLQDFCRLCSTLLGLPDKPEHSDTSNTPISSTQWLVLNQAKSGYIHSLDEFIDQFFQARAPRAEKWMTETVWNVTVKLPKLSTTEASLILKPPTRKAVVAASDKKDVLLSFEEPKMEKLSSKFGFMRVRSSDLELAERSSPQASIRLIPVSDETSSFSFTSLNPVYLGRATLYSDFLAQFRPRNHTNDSRTLKISRQQAMVEWRTNSIYFKDAQARNPSTYQFQPVPEEGMNLKLPVQINLAGEYPLEILHLASDFPKAPTIEGFGKITIPETKGGLLFRACGSGVYLTECCLLFTDITLHFSDTGRSWLKGGLDWDEPFARVHRIQNQFWLEPLETNSVYLMDTVQEEVPLHELILLRPGRHLRLGNYSYAIESYETQPFYSTEI